MIKVLLYRNEMGSIIIVVMKNKGAGTMRINDEVLDKLGIYFVYHEVYNKYGITFESFVDRWSRGILEI
ncbi:hypothetical protein MKX47_12860 [Solibacillus sp. FSL R7-0668]|uniref:hypothetical protein n=1 Tax=Solibacillus sp. FSL R7-0668 TaxID=2921688 RepID=UPI0030F8F6E0